MTIFAQQTDGFFRGGNNDYQNRGAVGIPGNSEDGISNYGIGETVPLSSGLLIMTAVGAGYAISKRRRNKGFKAINTIITMVLLLGMTNCKKNIETINTAAINGVFITLDVDDGNSNSRVIVDPENDLGTNSNGSQYATVTFEAGDVIYVGYNNTYVGTLTYTNGIFSGNVDITTTDVRRDAGQLPGAADRLRRRRSGGGRVRRRVERDRASDVVVAPRSRGRGAGG